MWPDANSCFSDHRILLLTLGFDGRGEVIRTLDPLHPMQVRYQAALRPDRSQNATWELYALRLNGRSEKLPNLLELLP